VVADVCDIQLYKLNQFWFAFEGAQVCYGNKAAMTIGTKLFTMLNGEPVGSDSMGNRYYRGKRKRFGAREKRWILYNGAIEASRIPPSWHSWLHHTTEDVPRDETTKRWAWQTDHVANMTGTPNAYRPPGHVLKGGERATATGDYEPWEPS
jgi:NADH:ubiquinone oxidoreductase subunit